jgi:hypothetical protein
MWRIDASRLRFSSCFKYLLPTAVFLLAILVSTSTLSAAATDPVIQPADAVARTGRTYGAWSAAWWQYVLAASTADPSNPLLSTTGQGCAAGQSTSGPVFFLAGTAGSGSVTRTECSVPSGVALFFPMLNAFDTHVPGDGLDTPDLVWADLQSLEGPTQSLFATVDGTAIGNLNPQSTPYFTCAGPGTAGCTAPAFTINLAGQNLFGIPGGQYFPTVDEGFYLLLNPLAPGTHTVAFGGTGRFARSKVSQNITYSLTVK